MLMPKLSKEILECPMQILFSQRDSVEPVNQAHRCPGNMRFPLVNEMRSLSQCFPTAALSLSHGQIFKCVYFALFALCVSV